jgi:hypothetical protein
MNSVEDVGLAKDELNVLRIRNLLQLQISWKSLGEFSVPRDKRILALQSEL